MVFKSKNKCGRQVYSDSFSYLPMLCVLNVNLFVLKSDRSSRSTFMYEGSKQFSSWIESKLKRDTNSRSKSYFSLTVLREYSKSHSLKLLMTFVLTCFSCEQIKVSWFTVSSDFLHRQPLQSFLDSSFSWLLDQLIFLLKWEITLSFSYTYFTVYSLHTFVLIWWRMIERSSRHLQETIAYFLRRSSPLVFFLKEVHSFIEAHFCSFLFIFVHLQQDNCNYFSQ